MSITESNTAAKRKAYRETARAMVELLIESFPKAFFMLDTRRKPLKVGIYLDIVAKAPAFAARELGFALRWYTRSVGYQRALMLRQSRIDLDGNPVGLPTPEEAEIARLAVVAGRKKQAASSGARKPTIVANVVAPKDGPRATRMALSSRHAP